MKNSIFGTVKISNGILFVLVTAVFIFTVFSGCVVKQVDPDTLKPLDTDSEEANFPPTKEELINRPRVLLTLTTFRDKTVTEERFNRSINFLNNGFKKYGNFLPIPRDQVEKLLKSEENRRFQPSNVADAIQLGKSLNASFVSQLRITIAESKIVESVDQFKTNINLTIFTTDTGQVVFEDDIEFDTLEPEESNIGLKRVVQKFFKLRGYILETRGGKAVARISLGRSMGVKLGRQFQVRERNVVVEMVNGVTRKNISFSPLSLATVTVIKVMENESWVEIDAQERDKVKRGQVVFSLPEIENIYIN